MLQVLLQSTLASAVQKQKQMGTRRAAATQCLLLAGLLVAGLLPSVQGAAICQFAVSVLLSVLGLRG